MTTQEWLDAYGAAWAAHDGAAAAALFSEDAQYSWGPFEEPLRGREAIARRWDAATAGHGDVTFAAEVLGRDGARVFARWQVTLAGPGAAIDGLFVLDFDGDGRCARLQEWFMSQP